MLSQWCCHLEKSLNRDTGLFKFVLSFVFSESLKCYCFSFTSTWKWHFCKFHTCVFILTVKTQLFDNDYIMASPLIKYITQGFHPLLLLGFTFHTQKDAHKLCVHFPRLVSCFWCKPNFVINYEPGQTKGQVNLYSCQHQSKSQANNPGLKLMGILPVLQTKSCWFISPQHVLCQ